MTDQPVKKSKDKLLERQYADDYEREMVRHYLQTHPDAEAMHWPIVPEEWLYEAGLITNYNKQRLERLINAQEKKEGKNRVRDYGFDGLARILIDGLLVYIGLQAKYYLVNRVCATDIGTFQLKTMVLRIKNPLSTGVLYTPSKLQIDLAESVADPAFPIRHVLHPWTPPDSISVPTIAPILQDCDKPLRADQVDALKQWEDKDGINALDAPCRWGKTIVAGHHLRRINANLVIAIAPLLVSVENLKDRLACFLPDYSVLLVDSDTDGTTDVEQIKIFLATTGKKIIYSTFKSAVDILSKIIVEFDDTFVLADEIHNANAQLCEFINQFSKGLMMSATMPEEIIDLLDINHTVYISFAQAIKDGIIVDYTLWLPHLTKAADGATSVDVDIPVEFSTYDTDLTAKAFYLATVMLKTGSRRCITYLSRQEECDRFIEVVTQIFEKYHGLTIWTGKIDSTISKIERKELLEAFQTGKDEVYHILTSVRILDEAVDIPRCDSVFITNVGEHSSDIRMMQRSQRSSTKDPKNPSKHNNIILWADGWEKCVGALDLLRQADPEFHKKVRIADCNYDKSGEIARIEAIKGEVIEFGKWESMKCLTIWERHVARIKEINEFIKKYKKYPIKKGTFENENRLAGYVGWYRTYNNSGVITENLKNYINDELPDFIWDVVSYKQDKKINEIVEFIKKYNSYPTTCNNRENGNEKKLSGFIMSVRENKRTGTLQPELEKKILTRIPDFIWDVFGENHINKVKEVTEFYIIYCEEPNQRGSRENEKTLANYISCRRREYKEGILKDHVIKLINDSWKPWFIWVKIDTHHEDMIKACCEFVKIYKEPPTTAGKRENETRLAGYISHRREDKRLGQLTSELEKLIMDNCSTWWIWNVQDNIYETNIQKIEEFYNIFKEPPKKGGTRSPTEIKLAACIGTWRRNKKKGILQEKYETQITEKLPWISWDPLHESNIKNIAAIKDFYSIYKEPPKSNGKRDESNEGQLATFMIKKRIENNNGTISKEYKDLIDKEWTPWFVWDPSHENHVTKITEVEVFIAKYHCLPNSKGMRDDGNEKKLGGYLVKIRESKKSGALSAAIIKLVEEKLPLFSWDPKTEERNILLKNIASFYTTYGEEPKQNGLRENGNEAKMAAYLSQRRNNKKKGTLSKDIEKQINKALPWLQWDTIYEHVLPQVRNPAGPTTTYATMSKSQLIEQYKEKNIKGYTHKTKIQLIESLNQFDNKVAHVY